MSPLSSCSTTVTQTEQVSEIIPNSVDVCEALSTEAGVVADGFAIADGTYFAVGV